MRVYVTYFRYDRGETYSLYHIDKNKSSSIQHYKETDLPSFLEYGPDDVSQLYLVRCDLTKSDFEFLKDYMENSTDEYDVEFYGIMEDLHDTVDNDDIIYSDTGDTNWELIDFFRDNYNLENYLPDVPEDEDELSDKIQEVLFNDDKVYKMVLTDYIKIHY